MRIVFMGTPEFAVPSLEALLRSDDQVVGVVTQPDRPKGRGQELTAPPVKQLAERSGVPVLQPTKMKDPAFLAALQAWQPDVIAVAAFGRILPPAILSLPPRGCLNVHGSLLPKYRGAAPIQWAIINGERETGITTMLMDEGMDTGAMLLQEAIPIEPDDTGGTLGAKLAQVGAKLLIETLRQLKIGQLHSIVQDHSQATLAPILKKEHGLIDWNLSAAALANRVRGLAPWPGAYTFAQHHNHVERWSIWEAHVSETAGSPGQPGAIIKVEKDRLLVATGEGALAITAIQPAGGRRMTVAQYLAGHAISPGVVLGLPPAEG
jgi:methionyl-tRNA formyltransferase